MNRRSFLRTGTLVSATLPAYLIFGCQSPSSSSTAKPVSPKASFAIDEFSISQLQEAMQRGVYSSKELVAMYLERIHAIDQKGPELRSVIEINPDALSIATALDEERKAGRYRGPLHGIPFLVKDNIDTGDQMMTTAGSLALSGHYASADAPLVRQLRDAGAVLIGKTNLSEWANFRSGRSSSGWSSRGGQTCNPYILQRNPCGSSSGSGVAVAANLCAFAIGTETNGSISCPSSVNGIVGLKPTVGLVSRTGIIPISQTQDTAGPMTRTVRDAAIVLGAMTASDTHDVPIHRRPERLPDDYERFLNGASLSGKRIGVEQTFLKVHEKVDALLADAIARIKDAGATIMEVDYASRLKDIGASEYKLLKYEFKDGLNRYLAQANAGVRSLKDVIAYNEAHANTVMPFFGQDVLVESEKMQSIDTEDYKQTLHKVTETSRQAIDGILKEYDLDALCGPATGAAWCTDLINGDAFSGYGMGSGAAMAGYPSITVPLGDVLGLPVGLLFMSTAYSEPDLLAIAHAYESVNRKRKAPSFSEVLPTLQRDIKEAK